MKLQLDTVQKTIKIEESVNLKELMDSIKLLLPNGMWKEFSVMPSVFNYWNAPYIAPLINYPSLPTYPWITYVTVTEGTSITSDSLTTVTLTEGTFNIEIN